MDQIEAKLCSKSHNRTISDIRGHRNTVTLNKWFINLKSQGCQHFEKINSLTFPGFPEEYLENSLTFFAAGTTNDASDTSRMNTKTREFAIFTHIRDPRLKAQILFMTDFFYSYFMTFS